MNPITHVTDPERLLLVWQAPEGRSRSRYVVGELRQRPDSLVFSYLPLTDDFNNACKEGFVCYPAFRKTNQEYTQGVLATFLRRLPPRTRGDFGKYLAQWQLAPDAIISDFALLGFTGAKLPNDGFSLINPYDPKLPPSEFYIEVAGFRHQQTITIDQLSIGMAVAFVAEPSNQHNSGAVVIEASAKKIGYVNNAQCLAFKTWLPYYTIDAQIANISGTQDRPLVYVYGQIGLIQNQQAVA